MSRHTMREGEEKRKTEYSGVFACVYVREREDEVEELKGRA